MRAPLPLMAASAALLLLGACHGRQSGDTVVNTTIDNTVGTASDEMTNIDAATGSSTNMAADVNSTTPAEPGLSDSGDSNSTTPATPAKPKRNATAKPKSNTDASTGPGAGSAAPANSN
ncbi:MAG: hypothetical protein KGQ42_04740 [Alphaproteobacteria bacterium]|nr:hypothetical protein [Alphaproteobacteria bacterium]